MVRTTAFGTKKIIFVISQWLATRDVILLRSIKERPKNAGILAQRHFVRKTMLER